MRKLKHLFFIISVFLLGSSFVRVYDEVNYHLSLLGDGKLLRELVLQNLELDHQDSYGNTLLHYVCDTGNIDMLKILLESQANPNIPNQDGETPIFQTVRQDSVALLINLKENKAQLEIQNLEGDTPLHISIKAGSYQSFQYLLAHVDSLEVRNIEGDTPLLTAVKLGRLKMIKALLEKGVNEGVEDIYGNGVVYYRNFYPRVDFFFKYTL